MPVSSQSQLDGGAGHGKERHCSPRRTVERTAPQAGDSVVVRVRDRLARGGKRDRHQAARQQPGRHRQLGSGRRRGRQVVSAARSGGRDRPAARPGRDSPQPGRQSRRCQRREQTEQALGRQRRPVAVRPRQRRPDLPRRAFGARPVQPAGRLQPGKRPRAAGPHPGRRRPAGPPATGHSGVRWRQRQQGAERGALQRPAPGRATVAPHHAVDPRRRVRRAGGRGRPGPAGAFGCRGDARPDRPAQSTRRLRWFGLVGDRADRDGRRDRLRAVLHPPRARGARGWPLQRGGARAGGGNLGTRGARLRDDRDDRDGGLVPDRQRDVHLVRSRDDDRGRGRDARLGHLPAGDAGRARRSGEQGPHPVVGSPYRPAADDRVGQAAPPRVGTSLARSADRVRPAGRAGRARARAAHRGARRQGRAGEPPGDEDLRADPGRLPGQPGAGRRRRPGSQRGRAGGGLGRGSPRARRATKWRDGRAALGHRQPGADARDRPALARRGRNRRDVLPCPEHPA